MISFVCAELNKVLKSYKEKTADLYNLAGTALIEFMSFRLPKDAKKDKFLSLRILKKLFVEVLFGKNEVIDHKNGSGIAVLDNSYNYIELRGDYIRALLGNEIEIHLCREVLLRTSGFNKFKLIFTGLFIFIRYFSFFSLKNMCSVNYALLIQEIPEIINLINILKKRNIHTLIDFANYEVDANFIYLLLKKNNITVYKVPSPGPLYIHNRILLTDTLVVSSGYHLEELSSLRETLIYQKVMKFLPEMSPLFIGHYNNPENCEVSEGKKNTIGFYSHASWLRELSNHADNGMDLLNMENNLLALMRELIVKQPQYKILIFLHPRERNKMIYPQTIAFYKKKLGNIEYSFAPSEFKSTESFNKCNIALVALSTILFERLLMGFKTLIYSDGKNGFPATSSVLNSITFNNMEKLEFLMDKNKELNNREFFNAHHLNPYLLNNFNRENSQMNIEALL